MSDKKSDLSFEFVDNQLLISVLGPDNINLKKIVKDLDVEYDLIGNFLYLTGGSRSLEKAKYLFRKLYDQADKGEPINAEVIDMFLRFEKEDFNHSKASTLKTKKKDIGPRSKNQDTYIKSLLNNDLVFGIGPAGTGKTYLAVAAGVHLLLKGVVDRLILSRPVVEAGEKLGFLPGDLKEKIDPYLKPLYDALGEMLTQEVLEKKINSGVIEIAPLAFMRGRTLANAFIILDEAQNTTDVQMKMFLTRLGYNAKMVVTGDLTQIDLPKGIPCGLKKAVSILGDIHNIDFVYFDRGDVVRNPLVADIIDAYDRFDNL